MFALLCTLAYAKFVLKVSKDIYDTVEKYCNIFFNKN